jgi:MFS family permease
LRISDERSREEAETMMNEVSPPRISRRRAVVITVAGVTVVGALVGALWAWLAPPIHGVVALTKRGERVKAFLGNEADHFFVAAVLMVGLMGALAIIAAVLLWQWRTHRGPVMVAALAIGAAAAAGAAAGVGAALVHWRYGTIDIAGAPVSPEHRVHYVIEAPAVFFGHSPLQIAATILLPAATAALVYALMVVSTQRDDLGAWPPVEEPVIGPPVTAESALPSAQ